MRFTTHLLAVCLLSWVAAPAFADDDAGVTIEIERSSSATPDEMREFAEQTEKELASAAKDLAKLDADARKKVEDGLDCVTSGLTGVRALLDVAQKAARAMNERLDEGNKDRADHELRKIAVSRDKGGSLRDDAERCALGVGIRPGEAQVKTKQTFGDPDEDIADEPFDPGLLEAPTPETSPF